VGNNSVDGIDKLGLADFRFDAKTALIGLIRATSGSSLVGTMNKGGAVRKLWPIIDQVEFFNHSGTPHYTGRKIYVDIPFTPSTLVHELVHAYNDIMATGLQNDDVRDEGVARAFEGLLQAAHEPNIMERVLSSNGFCNSVSSGQLKRFWSDFWTRFGEPGGYPGSEVRVPYHGNISVLLDVQDFRNLESLFGFRLSCKEFASYINSRLDNCCYTVTCNKEGAQAFEIPAGVDINPIFR